MRSVRCCVTRSGSRGFSLIELLVVFVVIGILAALLLPAYVTARQNAGMTPCISNLRQIGMAVKMYMDDHNGGRPIGFQPVYDGGYFKSQAVLLCPEDPTGNWGGNLSKNRKGHPDDLNRDWPPSPLVETIHYSYLHPFTPDWPTWRWKLMMEVENGNPGIAACQLHGRHTFVQIASWPHTALEYEGRFLRLQLDGAVVKKLMLWKVTHEANGITSTTGRSELFFSDTLPEAMDRYFAELDKSRAKAGSNGTP